MRGRSIKPTLPPPSPFPLNGIPLPDTQYQSECSISTKLCRWSITNLGIPPSSMITAAQTSNTKTSGLASGSKGLGTLRARRPVAGASPARARRKKNARSGRTNRSSRRSVGRMSCAGHAAGRSAVSQGRTRHDSRSCTSDTT